MYICTYICQCIRTYTHEYRYTFICIFVHAFMLFMSYTVFQPRISPCEGVFLGNLVDYNMYVCRYIHIYIHTYESCHIPYSTRKLDLEKVCFCMSLLIIHKYVYICTCMYICTYIHMYIYIWFMSRNVPWRRRSLLRCGWLYMCIYVCMHICMSCVTHSIPAANVPWRRCSPVRSGWLNIHIYTYIYIHIWVMSHTVFQPWISPREAVLLWRVVDYIHICIYEYTYESCHTPYSSREYPLEKLFSCESWLMTSRKDLRNYSPIYVTWRIHMWHDSEKVFCY